MHNKTSQCSMIIFHINIQYLLSLINCLEITLEELYPGIIVVCKHKMKINEILILNLQNYNVNSFYCHSNSMIGGVIILSKSNFKCTYLKNPIVDSY